MRTEDYAVFTLSRIQDLVSGIDHFRAGSGREAHGVQVGERGIVTAAAQFVQRKVGSHAAASAHHTHGEVAATGEPAHTDRRADHVFPVQDKADIAGLHLDVHIVFVAFGPGGEDFFQVALRIVGLVHGDEGDVGLVFPVVPHPVDADFLLAEVKVHLDVVLGALGSEVVQESVMQAEIVGAQHQRGHISLLEGETCLDFVEDLGGGIQFGLLESYPVRSVPGADTRVHDASLEAGGFPVFLPVLIPDGEVYGIAFFGLKSHSLVRDVDGAVTFYLAGVPELAAVNFAYHGQLIGRLFLASNVRVHPPAEDRVLVLDGKGPVGMLDPEVFDGSAGQGQGACRQQEG